MPVGPDVNARWTRLEAMLTEMRAGDAISVDTLVAETGLLPDVVVTVLADLERVELFRRQDDKTFVRRSLWESSG
jgi:hypothetical protein